MSRIIKLKDIYYLLIELFNGKTFNSIYVMDTIDISQNIQDFKQVFEKESRIVFSARFGEGKSYFLMCS